MEDTHKMASRWPRFFARIVDTWLELSIVALAMVVVMALSAHEFFNHPASVLSITVASFLIALIFDALIYKVFGNTLGKALLGIRVEMIDSSPLTFSQYLSRNFSMWVHGMALGIPLIQFVAMYYQFSRLGKGKQADYDEKAGYLVRAKAIGLSRKIGFGVVFLASFFVVAASSTTIKLVIIKATQSKNTEYSYWKNPVTSVSAKIDSSWVRSMHSDANGQQTYMFTEKADRALLILGVQNVPGFTLEQYVEAFKQDVSGSMQISGYNSYYHENGRDVWRGTGRSVGGEGELDSRVVDVQIVKLGDDFWRIVTVQGIYKHTDYAVKLLQAGLWSTVF